MKTRLTLLLLVLISGRAYGQAPFTTVIKEPIYLKKISQPDGEAKFTAVDDIKEAKLYDSTGRGDTIQRSEKVDVGFFKNNGLSINLLSNGNTRMSVGSQVIHYKLYVANPNEKNTKRVNRYNIPLLLVTKLSSNYDSVSAGNALDILDYEAAPITLRMMPSISKSFKNYNDVIYFGLYTDLRGINTYNAEAKNYSMNFVGSGGIGLTYQGDGAAGTYNPNGEYASGRYSVSVMYQMAYGKPEFLSQFYKTSDNYVSSIQAYFVFQVSKESKLNLKASYQRFFQETNTGLKHNFSVAMGI